MSTPAPPRADFGIRFSLLARRWRRVIESQLAAAGLTDATWVPLVHLQATGGGLTQKQLAARVGIEGSSIVRVLDILEREALIERRRDAADGRARLIHLTPAGERRVEAIRAELARVEAAILRELSDAELAGMLARFAAIERGLDALTAPAAQGGALA